ncbi:MAG: hypothetical protein KY476_00670 [Planctomycetes bacterium]|nr:hypothetical protein [Planctomycetota bacterium]
MRGFPATRASITPVLTDDNFTLVAGSSESAQVKEVHFGGEATTSTAMHTRVARSTGGNTATTGTPGKLHPHSGANAIDFATGWTTQPTIDAAPTTLFGESWNAHGGVVRWLADIGEEFVLIGAGNISCRNSVGTGTSSYGVVWEEP